MERQFIAYTVSERDSLLEALKKIDANRQGFVIATDETGRVLGVLTDGDVRRALIRGATVKEQVGAVLSGGARTISETDGLERAAELFKNPAIRFVPVVDEEQRLRNILTRGELHALLLQDIQADLSYDFSSLDTGVVDHEIYVRPWGFYKTTVLNDYYQAKVISIMPGKRLSLQYHNHREEHWIVVHGRGLVQLEQSTLEVSCGHSVFIPKGALHRLANTDERESLIITEVQLGDYLGEDDIIRVEDDYGREGVER